MVQITESQLYNTVVFTILGSILFLGFFVFLVYKFYTNNIKAQTQLFNAVLNTQETERTRIAADLHDDIGANLSAIKVRTFNLKKNIENAEKVALLLDEIVGIVNRSIPSLRETVRKLAPHKLNEIGLEAELNNLANMFFANGVDFKIENNAKHLVLDDDMQLQIYRIAQELLNNAYKYSKAKKISMVLGHANKMFTLNYADNGVGFDTKSKTFVAGLGLKNIQARTQFLKGSCTVESEIDKGTKWNITIPIAN